MNGTSLWNIFCGLKEIKEDTIYNCELWAKENGDFEEDAALSPADESVLEFVKDYINQLDLSAEISQSVYDEYHAIENFYKKHKNNGFKLYKPNK